MTANRPLSKGDPPHTISGGAQSFQHQPIQGGESVRKVFTSNQRSVSSYELLSKKSATQPYIKQMNWEALKGQRLMLLDCD